MYLKHMKYTAIINWFFLDIKKCNSDIYKKMGKLEIIILTEKFGFNFLSPPLILRLCLCLSLCKSWKQKENIYVYIYMKMP